MISKILAQRSLLKNMWQKNNYKKILLIAAFLIGVSLIVVGAVKKSHTDYISVYDYDRNFDYVSTDEMQVPVISSSSQIKGEIAQKINEFRLQNHLLFIVPDDSLQMSADAKARALVEADVYAHNLPDGRSLSFFIEKFGFKGYYAGENLVKGMNMSAVKGVNAWINSLPHKELLLNEKMVYYGIGVAKYKDGTDLFVLHMGSPVNDEKIK